MKENKSKPNKSKLFFLKWIANNDLKVFLLSLLISTIIWSVMKLSDENTYEYKLILNYTDIPEELLIINKPDSIVTLNLTSQGFKFFTNVFSKNEPVNISMKEYNIPKLQSNNEIIVFRMAASQLTKQISQQLNLKNLGKIIKPDSIVFKFSEYKTKLVPVKAVYNLSFRNNYQLYSGVILDPKEVTISGPRSILDEIQYLETETVSKERVGEDFQKTLSLIVPENIVVDQSEVVANFRVANYTELEKKVKININNRVKGVKIKTFPDFVTVKYIIAVDDFEKINEKSFIIEATIDSLKLLKGDELIPKVREKPDFVKNVTIKEKTIDYIIIE